MSAEVSLVLRYLLGLGRRTHVVTITLISLIGLALGVLALVVTLALLEGFQSTIRDELVRRTAHVRISASEERLLDDPAELVHVLHDALPEVPSVSVARGTCLVGSTVDTVPASIVGRSDVQSVRVDRVLAARLAVGTGERIEIVSPQSRLTPLGPLPVRAPLEISDVVAPPPGDAGGIVVVPLETAQRLLWGHAAVDAIELADDENPWDLAHRVRRAVATLGAKYRVEGLRELHRPLLLALALERAMIFLAVGLMLAVASLNLLCNVAMVAAEKRRDLALLAGLGMSPPRLRRLFLMLGAAIGAAATVAGALGGSLLAVVLDATEALPLPRGIFVVSSVPFTVRPASVAAVVATALVLSIGASWLPARLVGRREPAEGLRYE